LSNGNDPLALVVPPFTGRCAPRGPRFRILALSVLLSACWLRPLQAYGQDAPAAHTDSIRGTVVNSTTHEPLARALVSSADNRFATMTDDQGRFEFTFPPGASDGGSSSPSTGPAVSINRRIEVNGPNRPSILMARKPGFLTDENNQWQNLQLGPETKEITISLVPEALIVGHVVLPTSEPPDRIGIEIYRRQVQGGRAHWVSAGVATTKSNGEFRFSELAAGAYKLFTHELMDLDPQVLSPGGQPYGYAPAYYPNMIDFASANTIQLSAGKTFAADLSLVRQPYYPVKVAVTNLPGGLDLNIIVSAQGRRGPGYTLGYNPQDQTIEGMLPNGIYTLEASVFGSSLVSGSLSIGVRGAAVEGPRMTIVPSRPINVNVEEEFTSSDYNNVSSYSSGGRTFNLRGPRRYLNVTLEPADDFGQNQGGSLRLPSGPQDETLAIDNVQAGRYWVRIDSSRGYASSVTSGGIDLQQEPLVVPSGGTSSPIEVTMRDDSAQIEGTIEAADASMGGAGRVTSVVFGLSSPGSYTPFAYVYCVPLPDGGGQFSEVQVLPDGKFTALGLTPGVYRVLCFKRPPADFEYRDREAMRAYDSKGQIVRLVAGQKEYLRLQLISTSE